MKSPKKILFIHLPKTGGTSMVWMIRESLGERYGVYDAAPDLDEDNLFVAGHLSFAEIENLLHDSFAFTIIRRPVDQLTSIYRFWKSHTDDYIDKHPETLPHCRLARDLEFEDFIRDERARNLIDNRLVRAFTSLEVDNKGVTHDHYESALVNLRRLDFVMFFESYEASCETLFARLKLPMPSVRHDNNLDNRVLEHDPDLEFIPRVDLSSFDSATKEVLTSLTRFDEMLYSCFVDGKN